MSSASFLAPATSSANKLVFSLQIGMVMIEFSEIVYIGEGFSQVTTPS